MGCCSLLPFIYYKNIFHPSFLLKTKLPTYFLNCKMPSSLFLSTCFLLMMVMMPSVVLGAFGDKCAFGVDESKTPPEAFLLKVEFGSGQKCTEFCQNFLDLPVGGRLTCKWLASNYRGFQECSFVKLANGQSKLDGVCPGESGKGYEMSDNPNPGPKPKPNPEPKPGPNPEPKPEPNPDPEQTDGSFGGVKAMPIIGFVLMLFGIQVLVNVVGDWHFLLLG